MTEPRLFEPSHRAEPPRFAPSIFDSKTKMQLAYDDYGGPIWVPIDYAAKLPPCTDPDALYAAAMKSSSKT